jgi:succinylarginine dihydrolase
VKVVPGLVGLAAIATMMFDGLVQAVIRPRQAPLASVVIRTRYGCSGEDQKTSERSARQHRFAKPEYSGFYFSLHSVLLS